MIAAPFVIAAWASVSQAQSAADGGQESHGLSVMKFSWSKERIGWEGDPFAGAVESFDDVRVRARNDRRIDEAKRNGNTAEVDRIKREARADSAILEARRGKTKPPRYVFLYKASFKNTGEKTVKAVDWDYVFFDKGTTEERGRLMFTSEGKIAPGKTKEFSFLVSRPPTQTISAYVLEDDERKSLDERLSVVRVEYTDGTVWHRP